MLFPTLAFLLFFIAVVAVLVPFQSSHRARKIILLAASYIFYAQWNPWFCLLLAASSLVTWAAGIGIERHRRHAWPIAAAAVTLHLAVLCAFKYADLLVGAANGAIHATGHAGELPFLGLILPIGISFFTFHGISYVVDVYRRDVAVCRNIDDMLLYLAFFPQLVAGPIVRASFFLPQLYAAAPARLPLGPPLLLIVTGLFKKVVVANALASSLVDPVFFDPKDFASLDLLLAAYGYAIQIFCDFSGYTDIAIGLAALLGYRFPPNFDQPYRASSFQEFWRRWHISLSFWLRDYLYKPLGGSRHGPARTYLALAATMLLGGLWHGAAAKFLVWGAIHGAALAMERAARPWTGRLTGPWVKPLATLLVFHTVCLAWVFFRADSLETAVLFIRTFLEFTPGTTQVRPAILALIVGGLLFQFTPPGWPIRIARQAAATPGWALAALGAAAIAVIDAMGPDGTPPFIYFQF